MSEPPQSQSTPSRRKKKASIIYAYTRFPEINENEGPGDDDFDEEDLEGGSSHRRTQFLGAIAANMGALALGTVLSWPAVALPSLRKDPSINKLSESEESWIGSIVSLGAVTAGPVAGFAIERIGRRGTMMVISVPFFLSWLLIHWASSVPHILVGRYLTGFFAGVFAVAAPIFTAEVTDVGIRGSIGSTFDMMISFGILCIYIVGAFLPWRTQALACSIIPLVILLLMSFVPESPVYLAKKGRLAQAQASLLKYRGASRVRQVQSEFEDMVKDQTPEPEQSSWSLFCHPWILYPVFIGFMIYTFQVISGLDPVLVYTVDIFQMSGADVGPYTSTIIIGTLQTAAGVLAASVVERSGRRFLLLVSETFMILALGALGLYFYLKEANEGKAPQDLTWLPLTSLAVYVVSYSVGMGPVGYTLMGEILPL